MLVITLFCIALFVLNQNTVAGNSLASDGNQLSKVEQIIDTKEGILDKKNVINNKLFRLI